MDFGYSIIFETLEYYDWRELGTGSLLSNVNLLTGIFDKKETQWRFEICIYGDINWWLTCDRDSKHRRDNPQNLKVVVSCSFNHIIKR